MKKFFLTLALFATTLACSAQQKSYVTVSASMNWLSSATLSGAIPASMKKRYASSDFIEGATYERPAEWIGNVFNLLAAEGFVLEHVSSETYYSSASSNNAETIFIFSKNAEDPSSGTRVEAPAVSSETEAVEVGRYNLQGIPVKKSDKGLQIVVYSNYTTKTVVVQ